MSSSQLRPKVFYSKIISPEKLAELSNLLNKDFNQNKIGIKINIGNKKDKNKISPEFYRPLVNYFHGTVIDTNSLYVSYEKNLEEFSKYFETELLDTNSPDDEIEIKDSQILTKTYIGQNLKNFDSFIVISNYFDNREIGGVGAISELAIGLSSKRGKILQMTGGKSDDLSEKRSKRCEDKIFKEISAEVALNVYNYIKRNAIFINILGNINSENSENIGIFASTDPVALDKASVDFVYYAKNKNMIQRVEELDEKYLIDCGEKLGMGKKDYELIMIN